MAIAKIKNWERGRAIANCLAIAAALGIKNTKDDNEDFDGHFDDKYLPERHRKDSSMNNLQNLAHMRNPGIPTSNTDYRKYDSCWND